MVEHSLSILVQAGFYGDMVECLLSDLPVWVCYPARAKVISKGGKM